MSWRQFLKPVPEVLRVKRVLSSPDDTHKTLKTLKTPEVGIENTPVGSPPQWQQDFCLAHGIFNKWRGSCPCSIDDCLISKVIDSGSDIDKLRGLEVGKGITTDMVIDEWLESGEPAEDIFNNPTWLICMAEYLTKGK